MNQLKMDIQQTIDTLSRGGWSQRRIARELGIDRETVARYRRLKRQAEVSKPAIPPVGSEPIEGANPANVPSGLEVTPVPSHPATQSSNPAISPAGSKPEDVVERDDVAIAGGRHVSSLARASGRGWRSRVRVVG